MVRKIILAFACLILLLSLAAAQTDPTEPKPAPPAPAPHPSPETKAAASLQKARLYLQSGKVSEAEQSLVEGLAALPETSPLRKEFEELFVRVQAKGQEIKLAEAREKAAEARKYLKLGDWDNAARLSREGLQKAPEGSEARKDCETLLAASLKGERDLKKQKQLASLQEAQRLIQDKRFTDASTLIAKVFNEAGDQVVLARAQELWAQAHPSWWSARWADLVSDLAILKWPVYGVIIIIALYLVLRWLRAIYQSTQNSANTLQLEEIVDDTGYGLQDLIVDALYQYKVQTSPATAGLLRLEASPIPAAPTLKFQKDSGESELSLALEALPALGGTVRFEGLDKAIRQILRWLKLSPPYLKGKVSKVENKIMTILILNESDQIKVITATRDLKSGDGQAQPDPAPLEVARELSASLAYKVLYLFYNQASVPVAEAQDALRQGMKLLGQYISGMAPQRLGEAQKMFETVLKERPELAEAHLYQGIALDLLERHDEAIRHFSYVKDHAQERSLKLRAAYNEAISYLRKFDPVALEETVKLLNPLLHEMLQDEDFTTSPIKALAYAAQADAIALKPLFFKKIEKDLSLEDLLQREDSQLVRWKEEVKGILKELGGVLQEVTCAPKGKAKWDGLACRQLEWAIENARGDLYLSLVLRIRELQKLPELAALPHPNLEKKLAGYLQVAEKAYRLCEILLPPGVETLSNLGTLMIQKRHFTEARDYLDRVILLNKAYEYAYYRKAQSYDEEKQGDKVKEVITQFNTAIQEVKDWRQAPSITGFKNLYEKYNIPLPEEPV